MKKFYLMLSILSLFIFIEEVIAQRSTNRSSTAGRAAVRSATTAKAVVSTVEVLEESALAPLEKFNECMDDICISDDYYEKGRCRCSQQLPRIEKILRDIEDVQNEADKMTKELEALMNVTNNSVINNSIDNVYENINSLEKNAKNLAGNKLDEKTLVMEGFPLYEEAINQCVSDLSDVSEEDIEKIKDEYNASIEGDCGAYTTILKEKADDASNLLIQAQKNREMFDEQDYTSRNQLDTKACYAEYEACMKTECGDNFASCREDAKFEASIKKCEAVNYGKCEDNKATVLVDIRKLKVSEVKKDDTALSCTAAMGHINESGKCVFKVRYIAERCTSSKKCGNSQEKTFLPGESFYCDDSKGPFKELILGCKESCYLIGASGEEKYLGKNGSFFCASPDKVSLPVPSGWGRDGFPINKDLKRAF